MNRFAVLVALGALSFAGCATYPVQVTAARDSGMPAVAQTCFVQLENSGALPADSRLGQQALDCLRAALRHRGYIEVGKREQAAVLVTLSCGVEEAGRTVQYQTMSSDVARQLPPMSLGMPRPASRDVFLVSKRDARYRIAARIDARDAATGESLWRVETSSVIGPNDRHAILPVMIAAAEPHLNPTQSTMVEVAVRQSSGEVKALRNGS